MTSHLACLGLGVEDGRGLERVVQHGLAHAQAWGTRDGTSVVSWQDDSGARLVLALREGTLVDVVPSFAGTPGVLLAGLAPAGPGTADVHVADVVDTAGSVLTRCAVHVEQRALLDAVPWAGQAALVALGFDVTVHADAGAFDGDPASLLGGTAERADGRAAVRFGPESFVPTGLFTDAPGTAPAPVALLHGTVLRASRRRVTLTGQEFVAARVRTAPGEVDLCLPGGVGEVRPGNVVAGGVMLVARLADMATDGRGRHRRA